MPHLNMPFLKVQIREMREDKIIRCGFEVPVEVSGRFQALVWHLALSRPVHIDKL